MQWQACRKSDLYRYRSNGSISIETCSTACFLHPTGNLTARSHIQRCPSVFDTQWYWWVDLAPPAGLVLRWGGWVGKLPEQKVQDWGYRTLNTGCSGLFKPWAWLWSFVRNWQCMTTESWSSGIIHFLYVSLSPHSCGMLLTTLRLVLLDLNRFLLNSESVCYCLNFPFNRR